MSDTAALLDTSWHWKAFAGRWLLVADGAQQSILSAENHSYLLARCPEDGTLRRISPTDHIAKIIAAAPDVRCHAQSLINGIDIGMVRIIPTEHGDRQSLGNVLTELRIALGKSGAV